jgi:hypothetical protein
MVSKRNKSIHETPRKMGINDENAVYTAFFFLVEARGVELLSNGGITPFSRLRVVFFVVSYKKIRFIHRNS